jgi:hypothetical protein
MTPAPKSLKPTTVVSSARPGRPTSDGVGLSNPQMSQSGRKMLDLVNRLHSTG